MAKCNCGNRVSVTGKECLECTLDRLTDYTTSRQQVSDMLKKDMELLDFELRRIDLEIKHPDLYNTLTQQGEHR